MTNYALPELANNVHWVGVKDWNRRLFDALIPLPKGTSYNAYLVQGTQKVALIDSVNPGFEKELESKIKELTDIGDIHYIIMNHAEPDHAASIKHVMELAPDSILVTSEKGAKMADIYFDVPADRVQVVEEGDTLDLGGKTLRFIKAPWLHWPETMFTFLEEDRILFSCDFFGAHTAFGFYDDDD
ncbi:MBL fold metallo-hydrolase, partial [Methanosalsum natronophilum]